MDKKKLFISAFFIISVTGAFFWYYKNYQYWSSVDFSQRIEPVLMKRVEEARNVAPVEATGTLSVYYPEDKNSCDARVGDEREACYQRLMFYDIVNTENFARCHELEKLYSDYCMYTIAGRGRDVSQCKGISDAKLARLCVSEFAVNRNDISACDFFEGDDKVECIDRVKSVNSGGFASGEEKGDIRKCEEIKTLEYFHQCVLRSDDKCELLSSRELIDDCNGVRYFSRVITSGNKKDCSLFRSSRYRKVCESYFNNGKKFFDTDKDGIADNKELWFNTDPFSVGEEEMEIIEESIDSKYQEAINGHLGIE